MGLLVEKKGQQARWPQAIILFFSPFILILAFRWIYLEPFVIPSESMTPNLLIHDHILVKKYIYGLKPLWGDGWLLQWSKPQRGDVIVFRYPENRDLFFIKRLIGLPGDRIEVDGVQLKINGELADLQAIEATDEDKPFSELGPAKYYYERFAQSPSADNVGAHMIRLDSNIRVFDDQKQFVVPEHSYFVMGDNRLNSHDSRYWGFVPESLIVGRAAWIWLSCEKTLVSAPFICDATSLRPERIFKTIQ